MGTNERKNRKVNRGRAPRLPIPQDYSRKAFLLRVNSPAGSAANCSRLAASARRFMGPSGGLAAPRRYQREHLPQRRQRRDWDHTAEPATLAAQRGGAERKAVL